MNLIYPTNLPGFVYYHDPTTVSYKKSSMAYQNKKNYGEIEPQKSYSLPSKSPLSKNATLNQNFESSKEYEPDYVKLDKKVLRFFGYFKESIVEEELESGRIRLLVIYYYLTDDTISIVDTRQENSGIPQGGFLSRGKIFKQDGTRYHFSDFQPGKDVYIYGKVIRIYDADKFTREFCAENGIVLEPRKEIPEDPFPDIEGAKRLGKNKDFLSDILCILYSFVEFIDVLNKYPYQNFLLFIGNCCREFFSGNFFIFIEVIANERQIIYFHIKAVLTISVLDKDKADGAHKGLELKVSVIVIPGCIAVFDAV